jgi:chromosome segregation ATPase
VGEVAGRALETAGARVVPAAGGAGGRGRRIGGGGGSMNERRRRRVPVTLALLALSTLLARASAAQPPVSGDGAALRAIAASLERIEAILRNQQSAQVVTLRFERLRLLREEMAPLEGELRSMRNGDFWQAPELAVQRQRVEQIEKQIEEARLAGREQEVSMYEMTLRETVLQIEAMKKRIEAQRQRAEELESQLAVLRSERDAAVGEIDRLLARLENDVRRDRQP